MDLLKAAACGSEAASALYERLESINLPSDEKEQLAHCIIDFATEAKSKGSQATKGKENSSSHLIQEAPRPVIEVQLVMPRGKHGLEFYKSFFRLKSSKQSTDIAYSRIRHIAIIDKIPKDTRQRILLFIHLSGENEVKEKPGANAIVLQVQQDDVLDVAHPTAPMTRLKGPSAVVLCQAFGATGVSADAFHTLSLADFQSSGSHIGVEAVVGVNRGFLYPMKSAFCFLEKPAVWVGHEEIVSVEFARTSGGSSTFDLFLHTMGGTMLEFTNLPRDELGPVSSYVACCGLRLGSETAEEGEASDGGKVGEASDDNSEEEDSDFDPEGHSESEAEVGMLSSAAAAAEEESEAGSGSHKDDTGSEVSLVSDDDIPASKVKQLVDQDKQDSKKRRLK